MKKGKILVAGLIGLLLATGLAACDGGADDSGGTVGNGGGLSGTYSYDNDADYTVTFNSNGTFSGTYGGYPLAGTYTVTGNTLTLNAAGQGTQTWTIVNSSTIKDEDGDEWVKSGGNNNGGTNAPGTPTGVTAARNPSGSTTVTVTWNAVSGATGYRVYYSSTGSGSGSLEGSPATTSFESSNNSASETHYFRVSAVNGAGEGSPSSWVSVGPANGNGGTTVPGTPTGVTAERNPASLTTVTVTWNAVSGATGYRVYYSSTGSGSGNLEGSPTTTSFDSSGNISSGTHYFRVSAVNDAGEGSPSAWVSVGPASGGNGTAPSAPTGVSASAQSSSSIRVTWNTVSGATSYDVYYEIGSSTTKNFAGNSTSTSYTHNGLTANTTYYYYIKAKNSSGDSVYSDYSSAASATTQSSSSGGGTRETRLAQPTFSTCSISGNNAVFNWTLQTTGTTPNQMYDYVAPTSIKIEVYAEGTAWYELTSTLSGTTRTYTLNNWATWSYMVGDVTRVSIRVTCIRSGNTSTSAIQSYWRASNGTGTWVPTY